MRHVLTEAACQPVNFSVVKNYFMGLYHLGESWRKWLLKKSLRGKNQARKDNLVVKTSSVQTKEPNPEPKTHLNAK